MLDAAVADQATHLLDSLDDVIVRILFAGIQAVILLDLPAITKGSASDISTSGGPLLAPYTTQHPLSRSRAHVNSRLFCHSCLLRLYERFTAHRFLHSVNEE